MGDQTPRARHYISMAVSVVLNSATLLLLKAVAVHWITDAFAFTFAVAVAIALDPLFIAAVLSFLAGIYFWIIALKRIDLSLAYPSVSVSYALIAILSWRLFGEEIGAFRWIGIAVIMAGVTVMYLPLGAMRRRA
jgi:drug/metabolite transporter (DMT)-like permease